ncbi:hypothetical protein VIGAN_08269500, partial [Vigna angularis var. angularis]
PFRFTSSHFFVLSFLFPSDVSYSFSFRVSLLPLLLISGASRSVDPDFVWFVFFFIQVGFLHWFSSAFFCNLVW